MKKNIKIFAKQMAQKWQEYNIAHISRPKCSVKGCNNFAHNAGRRKDGSIVWRKNPDDPTHKGYLCMEHHEARLWEHMQYRLAKKDYCENIDGRLGFTCNYERLSNKVKRVLPLEVDHIDGNPENWDKDNLQTLCPNCHRIKTIICRDAGTPGRTVLQLK